MSYTKEITIKWSIEDVLSIDDTLTNKQAGEVLDHLKNSHDATLGINWDTISNIIGG